MYLLVRVYLGTVAVVEGDCYILVLSSFDSADGFTIHMVGTVVIVINSSVLLLPLVDLVLFSFDIVPFLDEVLRQTLDSSSSLIMFIGLDGGSGAHEFERDGVVVVVEIER